MLRSSWPKTILLIVGLLTLLALEISLNANRGPSSRLPNQSYGAPSYGFGGYELTRPTTEVGAQWRVPRIAEQSGDGNASTWIAVQSEDEQFIQLGTSENKIDSVAQYEIFWSDVAVSFHPQQLLEVNPGDLIKFTMNQTSRGWRLHYDDVTQKVPETVTIPYARGSSFNSAQWYQEDPTVGGLTVHLTYPSVALTTFSHMSVDEAKPQFSADDRSVLSTADGVYLIPTEVTHDHFTYANAAGPARQYLSDVFAYNAALYPFQVDMFYRRSPTSTVMSHLRSTLTELATKLKTQHWPRTLTSAVKGERKLVAAYAKLFQTFPTAPTPLSESALARLSIVTRDNYLYSDVLREQLGLPNH
ncbi:MAG TPA: G1 family glutamic endopeptidase [Acidimicrobiales bacterium]|nr:G1 family glutamic endopeptidase [Acidimicrobiales bacterium]